MRITVDLEPDLHRRVKIAAAQRGYSLAEIVRRLLTDYVTRMEAK